MYQAKSVKQLLQLLFICCCMRYGLLQLEDVERFKSPQVDELVIERNEWKELQFVIAYKRNSTTSYSPSVRYGQYCPKDPTRPLELPFTVYNLQNNSYCPLQLFNEDRHNSSICQKLVIFVQGTDDLNRQVIRLCVFEGELSIHGIDLPLSFTIKVVDHPANSSSSTTITPTESVLTQISATDSTALTPTTTKPQTSIISTVSPTACTAWVVTSPEVITGPILDRTNDNKVYLWIASGVQITLLVVLLIVTVFCFAFRRQTYRNEREPPIMFRNNTAGHVEVPGINGHAGEGHVEVPGINGHAGEGHVEVPGINGHAGEGHVEVHCIGHAGERHVDGEYNGSHPPEPFGNLPVPSPVVKKHEQKVTRIAAADVQHNTTTYTSPMASASGKCISGMASLRSQPEPNTASSEMSRSRTSLNIIVRNV